MERGVSDRMDRINGISHGNSPKNMVSSFDRINKMNRINFETQPKIDSPKSHPVNPVHPVEKILCLSWLKMAAAVAAPLANSRSSTKSRVWVLQVWTKLLEAKKCGFYWEIRSFFRSHQASFDVRSSTPPWTKTVQAASRMTDF